MCVDYTGMGDSIAPAANRLRQMRQIFTHQSDRRRSS